MRFTILIRCLLLCAAMIAPLDMLADNIATEETKAPTKKKHGRSRAGNKKSKNSQNTKKSGNPKSKDSKAKGAKPKDTKANAAKNNGAKANGAKANGAKSNGAKANGAKSNGAKANGAKSNGAKSKGAKSKGAKSTTAKSKGAKKATKAKSTPAIENTASHYYALKVNVPYAAAVVQNLEFEAEVAPQWSVAVPVMWSISDISDDHALRTIALQPEARWWTSKAGNGHFFGVHMNLAWYNLKWNDTRYQARNCPLLGAGLSYGYRLRLSAHWGAEFTLGFGYAYTKYDRYYNIDNGAKIGSDTRHYFGPDRLGISLVYNF